MLILTLIKNMEKGFLFPKTSNKIDNLSQNNVSLSLLFIKLSKKPDNVKNINYEKLL